VTEVVKETTTMAALTGHSRGIALTHIQIYRTSIKRTSHFGKYAEN
jgi:hypothetical protein